MPVIILVLISAALFANTLGNSFIWDDEELIVKEPYIKNLSNIPFLFSTHYWKHFFPGSKGQYRPIRAVTLAFDYSLWHDRPRGYHLTNLILHMLNVCIAYFIFLRLFSGKERPDPSGSTPRGGKLFPFFGALFFAAHPVHVESVAWIKNRSDLLASFFFLAAFLLFIRCVSRAGRKAGIIEYALSLLAYGLALLSKEMALSFPAILILFLLFLRKDLLKRYILLVLPYAFLTLSYLIAKSRLLGTLVSAENTSGATNMYFTFLTVLKTLGYYLMLLVCPFQPNVEHKFFVPRSMGEFGVLVSLGVLIALSFVFLRSLRRSKLTAFSIAWIFVTIVPASNIIYLSGRPIAEQRLYIPSFGFCLLLSILVRRLFSENRRYVGIAAVLLVIASYSLTVVTHNRMWKDSLTFWQKAVGRSPHNPRAYNNLGKAYFEAGDTDKALSLFDKSIRMDASN
ncbi:MAG: tetratricopeptide repeat protein, partial [Candidatus Omnitrophota bacterium]